jgi:hypothetical protein
LLIGGDRLILEEQPTSRPTTRTRSGSSAGRERRGSTRSVPGIQPVDENEPWTIHLRLKVPPEDQEESEDEPWVISLEMSPEESEHEDEEPVDGEEDSDLPVASSYL